MPVTHSFVGVQYHTRSQTYPRRVCDRHTFTVWRETGTGLQVSIEMTPGVAVELPDMIDEADTPEQWRETLVHANRKGMV